MLRNYLAKFQVDSLKSDVVESGELKGGFWGVFPPRESYIKKNSLGDVPRSIHAKFQVDPLRVDVVKSGELNGGDKFSISPCPPSCIRFWPFTKCHKNRCSMNFCDVIFNVIS